MILLKTMDIPARRETNLALNVMQLNEIGIATVSRQAYGQLGITVMVLSGNVM
jgi:hypothetical protein